MLLSLVSLSQSMSLRSSALCVGARLKSASCRRRALVGAVCDVVFRCRRDARAPLLVAWDRLQAKFGCIFDLETTLLGGALLFLSLSSAGTSGRRRAFLLPRWVQGRIPGDPIIICYY